MKPLLGTDRHTDNSVGWVLRDETKDRRRRIAVKRFLGVRLGNFDTIGTAMNICAVLPEWQIRILHEEIHAGQKAIVADVF